MAEEQEPALQGFSSTAESMKHVVKSTVNGAIKGAMIGGAVLGGLLILSYMIPGLNLVTGALTLLSGFFPASVGAAIGGGVLNAVIGATAVGAAVGLGSGVIGMDEAVEGRKAELVEQSEREVVRKRARMVGDIQFANFKAANAPVATAGPAVPSVMFGAGQGQERAV